MTLLVCECHCHFSHKCCERNASHRYSKQKEVTCCDHSIVACSQETTYIDSAMGMKKRFVGHPFLKQSTKRVRHRSFRSNAIMCWFPHSCRLLRKSARLIRAENKRTQLFANAVQLAEEKSIISITDVTPMSTTNVGHERKIVTIWMLSKGFLCRLEIVPKHFDKFKPETWPESKKPDLQLWKQATTDITRDIILWTFLTGRSWNLAFLEFDQLWSK